MILCICSSSGPTLNSPSKVLYVGSSTTGVHKRIKQHIGDGSKGTYALHLSHWFDGKYSITIKQYDKPREVIQIIEDDLSDFLGGNEDRGAGLRRRENPWSPAGRTRRRFRRRPRLSATLDGS